MKTSSRIQLCCFLSIILSAASLAYANDKQVTSLILDSVTQPEHPWHFEEGIKGPKLALFFVVDPADSKSLAPLRDRLEQRKFPLEEVKPFTIIDLQASWAPNFIIRSAIRDAQKKHPFVTFLFDPASRTKSFFNLTDKTTYYLLFKANASKLGVWSDPMTPDKVDAVIQTIEKNL